ncbi:MAG: hypothetical protein PHQ72_07505 [Hespellia sp.]|nr:hypothetical protein [Hespellia sp.]
MRVTKKKIVLTVLTLMMAVLLSGCKALMVQEVVDPTKTAGQSLYTGFDNLEEKGSDQAVVSGGGLVCDMAKVTIGMDHWQSFMEQTEAGTPCSIRIKQKAGAAEPFYRDLYFDGSRYRLIISSDPEKYDYTYDYLYDVTGRKNKNSRQSRIVFLSNTKDADFEDIIESIGKNDNDQKIDYQLVFRHQ